MSFADGELAWTSFDKALVKVKINYSGFVGKDKIRIHPTQKPIALYSWLLKNYGIGGGKILDTHLGSQSSRIASFKLGFDFWGCELDPDYFKQGCERFENECHGIIEMNGIKLKQGNLFEL